MEHLEDGADVYLQAVLSFEEPGREKCPGKSFPVSGVIAKCFLFFLCTHRGGGGLPANGNFLGAQTKKLGLEKLSCHSSA